MTNTGLSLRGSRSSEGGNMQLQYSAIIKLKKKNSVIYQEPTMYQALSYVL